MNLPAKRAQSYPSKPHRVTGKLKTACDLMVHGNADGVALEYDAAAREAGLTTRGMRLAMEKPWVRAYLRQQRAILIASLSATNPHHLATLRAKSPNQMTRLGAARLIEDLAGETEQRSQQRYAPGVTIFIGTAPPAPQNVTTIEGSGTPIPLATLTGEQEDEGG